MGNKRIFIGWNGDDNREIAVKVSNLLSEEGYSPIIGGQWRASFTVSRDIIEQMIGCDYAIILIEKEERKNKNGDVVSLGFNPNVMMELGYLLHKFNDANRIRRILINLDPGELPSDIQGTWTVVVDKPDYDKDDDAAKDKVFSDVARKVADDFFEYIENGDNLSNKLDYFDNWEENIQDILKHTGNVRIADKLIYGMQAAIYSDDYKRLYEKLAVIKDTLLKKDKFGEYSAVACAMAVLSVFVFTHRLTQSPTEEQFDQMFRELNCAYEKDIKDHDLRTWCKIFRLDKLELCYEVYAAGQTNVEDKREYYYDALELCHEILGMINEHITGEGAADDKYALIYLAFASRNVSQIHMHLAELEPEKAEEHIEIQKEYCAKTLEYRQSLFDYYNDGKRKNSLSMDFISQEYLLALCEQNAFETSRATKRANERIAKSIFREWSERNQIRNMIFEKVEGALSSTLKE
ncbi:MAG: nucleotide-binding protein [Clostridia bacterium]|nr:nucleotide-binding protein [Clostridia bacterium]